MIQFVYRNWLERGGDQVIQETIRAVKEAEAKAQQKVSDASVCAQGIIREAEKKAGEMISKAEAAAAEAAAADMEAAKARAQGEENTVGEQVEEELEALRKKADANREQAIQAVMDSLI